MSCYKVIGVQTPYCKSSVASNAALKAGSSGGTVLQARKISGNRFALAFGFGESRCDFLLILSEKEKAEKIYSAIIEELKSQHSGFGTIMMLNAGNLIKTGNIQGETTAMADNTQRELVAVILNRGFADDAMEAARKAGAGGGTVVNAMGTAREGDATFFGVHIVPEKEMLLIAVDSDKKESILQTIKSLDCLSEPGSGIAFTMPIENFSVLGKKK